MNNKIFLNKEAGFLAHTKRKRRFAVTLVGVFFMLLACAGAIGFGQVAYAADEKTVPNFKSPDPDYPWYGYDAYKGFEARYHDLRVNLKGSKEYKVYCFNLTRSFPRPYYSATKNLYKKIDSSDFAFQQYATNARNLGSTDKLAKSILYVIYNGYKNNANGFMDNIEDLNAMLVTQTAIWYYSDSSPVSATAVEKMWDREVNDGDISLEQVKLMRDALRKLISPDLEKTVKNQLPENYKLNLFISKDESIQNLLSAEYVPDSPPKPGEVPKEESPKEENPKIPDLDGREIPEVPQEPSDPVIPPVILDGEEVPEVPSESLEPALPPLMPELDGQEVPEKPSVDLPIEVPRYEFNNKDQSPLAGESGETEYITEVYGNQQNPVDIDKKLPNETGFSGNMVETEDTKEPEVLMGGQSESVEFTKDTQTGMSGQTTPQVETEDTKEPGVLMGGQSESVEFTKDTQTGMSGFSETATVVEDTRPKLVFHFDNNEPEVEENREKPTKNITPILPATGDIENVLAFLGILILSVLSIFSLLKKQTKQ
ncbi:TPA: fibronectin-binding protein PrtF1/SfbI [Streptococcus pyogenes]|nr:fibronectin-binding protein PrtF1/SfbI [Streptococcus pyogenes]VHB07748.1 fibronectin-binding protein [Streptococcus pyogenes]VHB72103.1 fibronectin-binding protein [Streptococcus pyogenes]VHD58801.1 fibronectin-binding protein [Streptococcus pyogenes]VHD82130.1 fibronectin-binding protein [Streptococcus pyogenes]VHM61945.1 fibronectin-binding protein [Streptococcus pyogenes]